MKRDVSFLRERLASGGTVTGMQCFSASPVIVEAMGASGLDFTIIDMEHCPTGLETLAHLLRAADSAGVLPLVRVPEVERSIIGRSLDLGCAGIVIPRASPERCREALRWSRYAPAGERGACPVVRGAGYLPADWVAHERQANASTLMVPLIEDLPAVEQCDAILDLDGVEVVFVGPFDLAVSQGLSGADYRHPVLRGQLDKVVASARARGKHVMTTVGATIDLDYAKTLLDAGVRLLSFSADIAVFIGACRRIAALPGATA
jgi:4-hydroxy-2-oxoheptanedioate aldolase